MPLINVRQILFRNLKIENGEFFQTVEKSIRVYSNKIMNVFYELYKDGNASYEVPLCTITDPDLYGIVNTMLG